MRMFLAAILSLHMAGCVSVRITGMEGNYLRRPDSVADDSFFEAYAATRRFSLGTPRSVKITPDGSAVLFLRSGPRSFVQDLYEFDTKTGQERRLLTAEDILRGAAEELSEAEIARRERMRMTARGIASYQLSQDGTQILAPLSGRLFVIDRVTGRVTELSSDAGYPIDPQFSPDATQVTCVRNGDIYVMDVAGGTERQITMGATKEIAHGL